MPADPKPKLAGIPSLAKIGVGEDSYHLDDRIARIIANLSSFDAIRQFETNARRQNALTDDVARALDARSGELGRAIVAEQTGLDLTNLSPAEEKIVHAAAIYAGLKKRAGSHAPGARSF